MSDAPLFDLRATTVRILECSECHEPVASDGFSGRVTLRCGYCGFEDARELAVGAPAEAGEAPAPYRGRAGRKRAFVHANLDVRPPGLEAKTPPALREALLALLRARPDAEEDDEARVARERKITWAAAGLAAGALQKRDALHARAALETALEAVTEPVYRGLLLGRLSRLASHCGAPELAEKWLALVPTGLRVAEVATDLKVARAMIAHARGEHKGVLDAIGERDTLDELVGPSRFVGLALRVDAHERIGEGRLARQLWSRYSRGGAFALSGAAATFDLAPATRRAVQRRAFVVLPAGLAALWALLTMLPRLADGEPIGGVRVAVALGGFALVVVSRWL